VVVKPRGVTCVDLNNQIFKSELIFTIVILQFKTGVKSTLTSQIKELGAINTFGIKNWLKYEPFC
jgi:hypothetical protein